MSCLDCLHWKGCFAGKDWDARVEKPCEYFKDKNKYAIVEKRCEEVQSDE